jgi:hypothetical protein
MSERQKDTEFLRQCLLHDETAECLELQETITQAQRNERCLRRAVWLMVLLTGLAIAGLSYTTIFLPNFPQNTSQFLTPFSVKVFCAVGIASLICLLSFLGLGMIHRRQLDQRREECRRLATRLLESRLGKSSTTPSSLASAPEIIVNGNKTVVCAPEIVTLPGNLSAR